MNILIALLFFAGGLAFSYVNYLISDLLLGRGKKNGNDMILPFLRQFVNIGVLVLAYFIGEKINHLGAVLIGTAIGLTVPGFLFSYRLSKKLMSGQSNEQKKDDE